jgi:hypothetical protein
MCLFDFSDMYDRPCSVTFQRSIQNSKFLLHRFRRVNHNVGVGVFHSLALIMSEYWSRGGDLEDSSDGGSPGGSPLDFGYKNRSSRGKKSEDEDTYDFEIGGDGDDDVYDFSSAEKPARTSSSDVRRSSGNRQRKSTDDRMNEILNRNRSTTSSYASSIGASKPQESTAYSPQPRGGKATRKTDDIEEVEDDDGGVSNSWKSHFDNLMEGLNSPLSEAGVSPNANMRGATVLDKTQSDHDTSYNSDSIEISASDFQVGVEAAKRAKEKTTMRQRRQALDVAPHKQKEKEAEKNSMPNKIAASPDVTNKTRSAQDRLNNNPSVPKFQMSTALSAIQRSDDSGGSIRYGSVEKSDGDLYKMLGGTDNMNKGGRYGNISQDSNTSSRNDISDFSSDRDRTGSGGGGQEKVGYMSKQAINDDDTGSDTGDSELAQSAEMDMQGTHKPRDKARRQGFSGASGNAAINQSSIRASGDEELDVDADYSSGEFEEEDIEGDENEDERLTQLEKIRERWLSKDGPIISKDGEQSIDGASQRDNDDNDGDDEEQKRVEDLMAQMVDPADFLSSQPTKPMENSQNDITNSADASQLGSRLITAVGSASMVTSVPPPPPPMMTESAEMMMTTMSEGGVEMHSRTSLLDYSQSDKGSNRETVNNSKNSSLGGLQESPSGIQQQRTSEGQTYLAYTAKGTASTHSSHESMLKGLAVDKSQESTDGNKISATVVINRGAAVPSSITDKPQRTIEVPPDSAIIRKGTTIETAVNIGSLASESTMRKAPVSLNAADAIPVSSTRNDQAPIVNPPNAPVTFAQQLDIGDDRGSLSAGSNVAGVDAAGRSVAAPGGQPKMNKIVAVEIDPATLGITPKSAQNPRFSRTGSLRASKTKVSQSLDSHRSDKSLSSTAWPEELPMVPLEEKVLHAHLAAMESAEAKRIAAIKAQAARIREVKAAAKMGKKLPSHSTKPSARGGAKAGGARGGWENRPNTAPAGPAPGVQRLEQGTARLARQFEQLEKDFKHMRDSQTSMGSSARGGNASGIPVHVSAGIAPGPELYNNKSVLTSSTPTRSQTNKADPSPTRIPVPNRGGGGNTRNASHSTGTVDHSSRAVSMSTELALAPQVPTGPMDVNDPWDSQALATMRKIVDEGDKLKDREKMLAAREEALRVREALVELDYNNPNRRGNMQPGMNSSNAVQGEEGEMNPEVRRLKNVEEQSKLEIDTLKARILRLENDAAEVAREATEESKIECSGNPNRKHKKCKDSTEMMQDVKDGKVEAGVDPEATMTIKIVDYNALKAEIASQEILISGFQKENEKLVGNMRLMEIEYNRDKARFFDQRESINRDLNRLRNVTGESVDANTATSELPNAAHPVTGRIGISHDPVRRSAETLREELDKDAHIFSLKEQLAQAESGKGVREKELQQTIERLRNDNRDLQAKAQQSAQSLLNIQKEDAEQHMIEMKGLKDEINGLKAKLVWYAENQSLIDTVESDNKLNQNIVNVLKKELKKKGMDMRSINALCLAAQDLPNLAAHLDDDSDVSLLSSVTPGTGKVSNKRSASDIKRIKELEEVVRDLQDSLHKRNPDSIANIVRAANMSDSVQGLREAQAQEVSQMKEEMEEMRENFERRLRSIRQEHEKVKTGYENRISDLQMDKDSGKSATPMASATSSTNKAGGQARIKELEQECERTRTFYTRKIEDMKSKHEAQIIALKRGSGTDSAKTNVPSDGDTKSTDPDAITATGSYVISDEDKWINKIAEQRVEYEAKIQVYESRLDTANEELGTLRAAVKIEKNRAASGLAQASTDSTLAEDSLDESVDKDAVETGAGVDGLLAAAEILSPMPNARPPLSSQTSPAPASLATMSPAEIRALPIYREEVEREVQSRVAFYQQTQATSVPIPSVVHTTTQVAPTQQQVVYQSTGPSSEEVAAMRMRLESERDSLSSRLREEESRNLLLRQEIQHLKTTASSNTELTKITVSNK